MIRTYKMTLVLFILGSIVSTNAQDPTPMTLPQGFILALFTGVLVHAPTIFSYAKNSFFGAGTPKEITSTINQLSPMERSIENLLPAIVRSPTNTDPDDFNRFIALSNEKDNKKYSPALQQGFFDCLTHGTQPDFKKYNHCAEHFNAVALDKEPNISEDINLNATKDDVQ